LYFHAGKKNWGRRGALSSFVTARLLVALGIRIFFFEKKNLLSLFFLGGRFSGKNLALDWCY